MGEEHPPHPRVALGWDLAVTLQRYLPDLGQSDYFEPLAEMLAAPLPKHGHRVHCAIVEAAPMPQSIHNHTLFIENVQAVPLQRFTAIVAVAGFSTRAISSGYKFRVSFTSTTTVALFTSSRAYTTRQVINKSQ